MRRFSTTIALAAAAVLASLLGAQQPTPLPVVVNPDPAGVQRAPAVVSDTLGRLLIAWRDSAVGRETVLLQGFDRLGHRTGPATRANPLPADAYSRPRRAMNRIGRAAVAWRERIGAVNRILFRRVGIDGSARTAVLPPTGDRLILGGAPDVALDSLGNLALVWHDRRDGGDSDIYGNYYGFRDTLGAVNTDTLEFDWIGDFQINEVDQGEQTDPAVASDPQGNLLIAWRDLRPDSMGIFCRAFSSDGVPVGSFRLNESAAGAISEFGAPAVAAAGFDYDNSYFLVSWIETDTLDRNRLVLAKVDMEVFRNPPVAAVDTAFTHVRQRPGLSVGEPAIDGSLAGDVALTWSETEGGVSHLFGLAFNVADEALPPAVRLSSADPGFGTPAISPAVGLADGGGGFALVWEDTSTGLPDLRMQRYDFSGQVQLPVYQSPGSGGGDNRAVAFLGRPAGGYQMYWEHERADTLLLHTIRYDYAGRPLSAPGPAIGGSARQRRPVTAANPSGLQVLAWEESGSGGYRIMASLLRSDGSVARAPFSVASSSTSHLGSIAAAVSDSGRIYLLWERWAPLASAPALMLARLDSLGNQLGSAQTVAPAGAGGGQLSSVDVGPGGNLMVAWRQGRASDRNASIRARVYGPAGGVLRDRIEVSKDTLEFLGESGSPVVAASDSTGNFLVLWQEFFSDRNILYYRLYDADGDSVQANGQYRNRLSSPSGITDADRTFNSPAAAVDSAGEFLVLWSEVDPAGEAGLYGGRFDGYGGRVGASFRIPGVEVATLPVISILSQQRVAIAWQDTTGGQLSFLGVQLHFHDLAGSVLLASAAPGLTVHVDGPAVDSAAVAPDGSFAFEGLPGGEYELYFTRDGRRLAAGARTVSLDPGDPPTVDIGVAADLREAGPSLPQASVVSLAQNSPNPFNPSTTIGYTVATDEPVDVVLAVFDLRGRKVRTLVDGPSAPGSHRLEWDGTDERGRRMSSGVYFLRLRAAGETLTRKMVLIK